MDVFNTICILLSVLMFKAEVRGQCCNQGSKAVTCQRVPEVLTSRTGAPIDSLKASLTVGPGGHLLLQDTHLVEKLCAFNRARIPDRVVHANGIGAFGYFVVTDPSFSKHCKTSMFQHVGQKTEFVIRFSTPSLEFGSCDNVQNFRGAVIKFYTCDGNLDLTALSSPMFTFSDPALLASGVKVARHAPRFNVFNATKFWDFFTKRHEALNVNLYLLTSRGMPDGYRHMDFFTEHAFKVVNKNGHAVYVKFHFLTNQGFRALNSTYAASLCGSDPDYAKRDLFNSIAAGKYPSWTLYYQIMTFKQADQFRWNPFDLTKIWPEDEYPLHKVGELIVNRNPTDQFNEVEQAAFAPSHLVPGIQASPDKILQLRMFSYADTQLHRIGPNNLQLPVNRPRTKVNNNQRDGPMSLCDNQGDSPAYFPNSFGQHECPAASPLRYPVHGDVARYNSDYGDNYSQPRDFFRKLPEKEKYILYRNICISAILVDKKLQCEVLHMLRKVHKELASGVERLLAARCVLDSS